METAQQIDNRIGQHIREIRESQFLSRKEVASRLGITHQQLHKYEAGLNRIAASRLMALCTALGLAITQFFEGIEQTGPVPVTVPEMELARQIGLLEDVEVQAALKGLVRSLAETGPSA